VGMRKLLRDEFSASVERGEYPVSWLLRVGSIELLALDTEVVLGYRPKRINEFMALPITVCPPGSANRLITATGVVALPERRAHAEPSRQTFVRRTA
jgi:hypothetical protein